jgi:hypothetical protein
MFTVSDHLLLLTFYTFQIFSCPSPLPFLHLHLLVMQPVLHPHPFVYHWTVLSTFWKFKSMSAWCCVKRNNWNYMNLQCYGIFFQIWKADWRKHRIQYLKKKLYSCLVGKYKMDKLERICSNWARKSLW